MQNLYKYIAIAILGILCTTLFMSQCTEPKVIIKTVTKTRVDTVERLEIIQAEPIVIYKKGKTEFKPLLAPPDSVLISSELMAALTDSAAEWPRLLPGTELYLTPAFDSGIDTIANRDTLSGAFSFPAFEFALKYGPAPDSIYIKTITETIEIETPRAWYDSPFVGAGAVLAAELIIYILVK